RKSMVRHRRQAAHDSAHLDDFLDQARNEWGVTMATGSNVNLGYDVIVIGSGIAGALLAYRLAKAKVRVLILEAGGLPEENARRATLVRNSAASASKGQDSPYTAEARTPYYVPPPPAVAPQGGDEPSDAPYYNEEHPDIANHRFKSWYE